mgnify:CR=1 FL=1
MKTLAKKDSAAEERISRELFEAADSGNLDRMTALIARGGNVNARDRNGATVLMSAASQGNLNVMQFLIGRGADINAKDRLGRTALIFAAMLGNKPAARFLIQRKADVNARSATGVTALEWAKEGRHTEIVKMLKEAGAVECMATARESNSIRVQERN